jgi:hypothetical protein
VIKLSYRVAYRFLLKGMWIDRCSDCQFETQTRVATMGEAVPGGDAIVAGIRGDYRNLAGVDRAADLERTSRCRIVENGPMISTMFFDFLIVQ